MDSQASFALTTTITLVASSRKLFTLERLLEVGLTASLEITILEFLEEIHRYKVLYQEFLFRSSFLLEFLLYKLVRKATRYSPSKDFFLRVD
jgi:hypothetical protein